MAKEEGFSEPDPRIDLSGVDVARKILILASESGYQIEMDEIKINRFIPDSLFEGSLDDFWKNITQLDNEFEKKRKLWKKKIKNGGLLRILKTVRQKLVYRK